VGTASLGVKTMGDLFDQGNFILTYPLWALLASDVLEDDSNSVYSSMACGEADFDDGTKEFVVLFTDEDLRDRFAAIPGAPNYEKVPLNDAGMLLAFLDDMEKNGCHYVGFDPSSLKNAVVIPIANIRASFG
jgi:hypothetical protein